MKRVPKPAKNSRATLCFIVIATSLMLVIHFVSNGGLLPKTASEAVTLVDITALQKQIPATFYEINDQNLNEVLAAYSAAEDIEKDIVVDEMAKVEPPYEPVRVEGSPKIAIIIDDMGVDRARSFKTIEIDAPLTLAFLPYAPALGGITKSAAEKGHELMIHMPMEAVSSGISLGPIAVKTVMNEQDVKDNMLAAFESFDGYVGLNNHMGSKATQNPELMDWVMEAVKARGLYFVDSKTIGASVAAREARVNGLPTAVRDVFLDHENTPEFVTGALRKLERIAADKGYAIAIGHPKDVTINALNAWIPEAQARGFEIVHASALVEKPQRLAAAQRDEKAVAKIEPAAGLKVEAEILDPNSSQAREAILKKMLGQANP